MKKITDIKHIKTFRIIQAIVLVLAIYILIIKWGNPFGVFFIIGISWLLSLLLPYEYRGGYNKAQKNVFLKNVSPLTENLITDGLIVLVVIILYFLNK